MLPALVVASLLMASGMVNGVAKTKARLRLPADRAAVVALAPEPVEDEENAAVLWRKAFSAMVRWEGRGKVRPDGDSIDWKRDGVGETIELFRAYVASNAAALRLADRAAQMDKANWGLDYSKGWELAEVAPKHLRPMRALMRLSQLRAILAAQDNNWAEVEKSLRTASAGARHVAVDRTPELVCQMTAGIIEVRSVRAIESALSAPGAAPTGEDLRRLQGMIRDGLAAKPRLSYALEGARVFGRAGMDRFILGDLPDVSSMAGFEPNLPMGLDLWKGRFHVADRDSYEQFAGKVVEDALRLEAGEYVDRKDPRMPALHANALFGLGILPLSIELTPTDWWLDRAQKNQARWRMALAGLGVLEHALDKGSWPRAIGEIGVEASLLIDPFAPDRAALLYRIEPDGTALVWSRGPGCLYAREPDSQLSFRVRRPRADFPGRRNGDRREGG